MTLPTNGITADVIRDMMPPYQLNTDLLAAMLGAVQRPPPDATIAWRQARVTRLVQEFAGLTPADAPQARIAAEIVIVHEAIEDTLARAGAPELPVDQVCRLRRTASALLASVAALERSLVRHQQKPVPFFGAVVADGVDIAAIAAGWGGAGVRGGDGEAFGAGGGTPADAAMAAGLAMAEEAGRDDAPASRSYGGFADEPVAAGPRSERDTPEQDFPAKAINPDPAVAGEPDSAETAKPSPVWATVRQGPPRPRQDAGAPDGVVTRLDRGPGWTLEVVRPR